MSDEAAFDQRVRVAIATAIRTRGAVPRIAEVAADLGSDVSAVNSSFDRMIAAHVFIPERDSREIYAYDPFCVGPTDFRVRSGGREWWAICGWDALGIPAALGAAGTVDAACADCGDAISITVDRDGSATANVPAVLNVGVPAAEFWKDIYFT